MSKRGIDDVEASDENEPAAKSQAMSLSASPSGGHAGNSGGGGGGGGSGKGMPLFPPEMPLKLTNKKTMVFTKHFYFKIYANDWIYNDGGTVGSTDLTGYMTWIPYQALCMYISPNEYLDIVRQSNYACVKEAALQMKFKAVRTPFDANGTDLAEANGNLQFELNRFDGLEKMMPFKVADTPPTYPTDPSKLYTSHQELINRLYGQESFYQAQTQWPATMRERGLSYRPVWNFAGNSPANGCGTLYRNVNRAISSLPIGEYVTDRVNTNVSKMGDGYCFNKTYKPKNGIITMAPSAYNRYNNMTGNTRINQPVRLLDTNTQNIAPTTYTDQQYVALYPTFTPIDVVTAVTPTTTQAVWFNPGTNAEADGLKSWNFTGITSTGGLVYAPVTPEYATGGPPGLNFASVFITSDNTTFAIRDVLASVAATTEEASEVQAKDNFGYGYSNDMGYYSIANLENYTFHTSRNPPPLHHMPSFMIGAVPKTTKVADTIVQATLEFECTTSCVVEVQNVHPTYMNMSYLPYNDIDLTTGFADPRFSTENIWGGRWQHNETDVCLNDSNKHWNGSYGLAAKPLFEIMPDSAPLL